MYHISNDKRAHQSSEMVYEALKHLMAKSPFSEINVTDLVHEAKIGRSTFYRLFDAIEDVLHYKADEAYALCAQNMKRILLDKNNSGLSRSFFLPFFRYWYYNFEIIELLIRAKKEDILKQSFKKMVDDLRSEYPEVEVKNYNYFIEIRAAVSIAILSEWVKTNRQLSPEELFEIFKMQLTVDEVLLKNLPI